MFFVLLSKLINNRQMLLIMQSHTIIYKKGGVKGRLVGNLLFYITPI